MADDPWAVVGTQPVQTQADDPWAVVNSTGAPSATEDAAKAAGPALLKGAIGVATMPGTLDSILGKGASWAINKIAPDSGAAKALNMMNEADTDPKTGKSISDSKSFFPSQDTVVGKVEDKTGPLYKAKSGLGKGVETALEIAPSIATGGGGIPGIIAKSAGGGVVSEGAGEAAKALKGYLPNAAQPWAEPVARGVGAIVGTGLPTMARRAVTPLPAAPEQASIVAALKAKDPNFPMSAGQETGSPGLLALEGRSPKMADMPAKQEEAFTRGTMKEMGVDGLATPANVAKGKAIGDEIGNMRRGAEINQTEFPALNKDINGIVRKHAGTVGPDDAAVIKDIQNEIKLGAANKPGVLNMPGARYDYMRQKVQSAIEKAGTGTESKALSDVRTALDDAFHRSIPTDQSARLKELENQYANYNVLKNRTPDITKDTVTPKEVSKAVAQGFGNAAVNENRGTLAPWARNAERVMTPFPTPADGHGASGLGVILGGLMGTGAGYATGGASHAVSEGLVGAITGGHAADVVRTLKNTAGRAVASDPAQAYLRNQTWLPGQATTMDRDTALRLLMSPPVQQPQ